MWIEISIKNGGLVSHLVPHHVKCTRCGEMIPHDTGHDCSEEKSGEQPSYRDIPYKWEVQDKYDVWKTKDGQEIKVEDMGTVHILNCLNMFRRNGWVSKHIVEFYLTCTPPNGDGAIMAFEHEQDNVFRAPCTGWIDRFEMELSSRGMDYTYPIDIAHLDELPITRDGLIDDGHGGD